MRIFTQQERTVVGVLSALLITGSVIGYAKDNWFRNSKHLNYSDTNEEISTLYNNPDTNKTEAFPEIININTATRDQLISIRGIGPVRADKIIEKRDAMGGFTTLDDLLQVSGIGKKTLEKILPFITL